jgi:hypothetical protein
MWSAGKWASSWGAWSAAWSAAPTTPPWRKDQQQQQQSGWSSAKGWGKGEKRSLPATMPAEPPAATSAEPTAASSEAGPAARRRVVERTVAEVRSTGGPVAKLEPVLVCEGGGTLTVEERNLIHSTTGCSATYRSRPNFSLPGRMLQVSGQVPNLGEAMDMAISFIETSMGRAPPAPGLKGIGGLPSSDPASAARLQQGLESNKQFGFGPGEPRNKEDEDEDEQEEQPGSSAGGGEIVPMKEEEKEEEEETADWGEEPPKVEPKYEPEEEVNDQQLAAHSSTYEHAHISSRTQFKLQSP